MWISIQKRGAPKFDKTDSNHEKSEVKVVFIRNGFHTTLLHKTRKQSVHLELYFQKMDHVKTEKGNNIQNNSFFHLSKCPNVYNIPIMVLYCTFGQYLIDKRKSERTSNVHTHRVYWNLKRSPLASWGSMCGCQRAVLVSLEGRGVRGQWGDLYHA